MRGKEFTDRRIQLSARADAERAILSAHFARFAGPVRHVETVVNCVALLKSPMVIAGLAALLMRARGHKIGWAPKLLWQGWTLFSRWSRWRLPDLFAKRRKLETLNRR